VIICWCACAHCSHTTPTKAVGAVINHLLVLPLAGPAHNTNKGVKGGKRAGKNDKTKQFDSLLHVL
jgi:hypothetical protein